MVMGRMKSTVAEVFQIAVAIMLASVGLKAFLLPNGFLDGGVTGIAILLSEFFHINISLILPLASIPFFLVGYFTITKRILFKSILAIICLSAVIHFENFTSITDDKLIIATFGGVFLGSGIGLAIRNGAVLDGAELLGLYVNERFGFSIGSIIFVFNVILFGVTAIVLSAEVAMYSILTYLVTSKAIDFTLKGFENYVGLMIVSDHSSVIQQHLSEYMGHGMTVYQGVGGYGKLGPAKSREIIHVIINRIDIRRIGRLIDEHDPRAFVIEFDVNDIRGGKIRRILTTPDSR